jgi:hypothetical protein
VTAGTVSPYRSTQPSGRDGFAQLLRGEWTKFRSVRGWVIGMVVAALLTGNGSIAAQTTFAIQQSSPVYPQVISSYRPPDYYPLAPWAGFAVLCGYAVLAMSLALFLLRRRDA